MRGAITSILSDGKRLHLKLWLMFLSRSCDGCMSCGIIRKVRTSQEEEMFYIDNIITGSSLVSWAQNHFPKGLISPAGYGFRTTASGAINENPMTCNQHLIDSEPGSIQSHFGVRGPTSGKVSVQHKVRFMTSHFHVLASERIKLTLLWAGQTGSATFYLTNSFILVLCFHSVQKLLLWYYY